MHSHSSFHIASILLLLYYHSHYKSVANILILFFIAFYHRVAAFSLDPVTARFWASFFWPTYFKMLVVLCEEQSKTRNNRPIRTSEKMGIPEGLVIQKQTYKAKIHVDRILMYVTCPIPTFFSVYYQRSCRCAYLTHDQLDFYYVFTPTTLIIFWVPRLLRIQLCQPRCILCFTCVFATL